MVVFFLFNLQFAGEKLTTEKMAEISDILFFVVIKLIVVYVNI